MQLEQMRAIEVERQSELRVQEATRQARARALQKQLAENAERKEEERRALAAQEEQRKAHEAEEAQRRKEYMEKQKHLLIEWQEKRWQEQQKPASEKRQAACPPKESLAAEARASKKTPRQVEAEEQVARNSVAAEERPPLPPRQRVPVRLSVDIDTVSAGGAPSVRHARSDVMREVQAVSNTYGLSASEKSVVKKFMAQETPGAGRKDAQAAVKPDCTN